MIALLSYFLLRKFPAYILYYMHVITEREEETEN